MSVDISPRLLNRYITGIIIVDHFVEAIFFISYYLAMILQHAFIQNLLYFITSSDKLMQEKRFIQINSILRCASGNSQTKILKIIDL